jgi:competence protein ComEA
MATHRRERDDEPDSLHRLARALGATTSGWTPVQPRLSHGSDDDDDGDPTFGPRWRVTANPSALGWLVVVGLAVLVLSGYLLSRHHGAAAAIPTDHAPAPFASAATPTAATIVVDVGGRVRHPGLVTLQVGARVADAIAAAGGALRPADIATIDLAAHVTDGQLLLIGMPGAAIAGISSGGTPGPVDLNSATVEQLDALPGVGPVLAQRIIAWREAHGGFRSIDDLQQVPGIGARKFSDLKALVSA